MNAKKILITISIFLTFGCGFTPIFSNKNNYNFSIEQITFTGDRTINNFLKINLGKLKKQNASKKIFITAQTKYEKNILTKDATGKITNYELVAETVFIINPGNKELKFQEKKIMESMTDKFEEKKYEKIIKQNFSYEISNKLISGIMTIE